MIILSSIDELIQKEKTCLIDSDFWKELEEQLGRLLTETGKSKLAVNMTAGVVPKGSRSDAFHVAAATVAKVDLIVSWNFKHIVNVQRIRGYNSINIKNGYQQIEIRSPRDFIIYEDDN